MYECDAKYGPIEKYPESSVQHSFILMLRRMERESKGCEAVGETHEFVKESRSTIAMFDANKKVIGDISESFHNSKARFAGPAIRFTGRTICRHCGRIK